MLKSPAHKATVHEIPKGQAFEAVSFGFLLYMKYLVTLKCESFPIKQKRFARMRTRTLCSVMNFNDIEW